MSRKSEYFTPEVAVRFCTAEVQNVSLLREIGSDGERL